MTLSEAPPPPRLIEKPLAFQKRLPSVTRMSLGAPMKRSIITSPASVRLVRSAATITATIPKASAVQRHASKRATRRRRRSVRTVLCSGFR